MIWTCTLTGQAQKGTEMSNTLQAQPIIDFFGAVCELNSHGIHHGFEQDGTIRLGTEKGITDGRIIYFFLTLFPRPDRGSYIVNWLQTLAAVPNLTPEPQHLIADYVLRYRGKRVWHKGEDPMTVPIEEMWMIRTPENLARLLKDYAVLAQLYGYPPLFDSMIDFDLA